MKLASLVRELVYPLSHYATILPLLVSWLLFSFVLVLGLYGLLLFLTAIFPFLRYVMRLLEARAYGREAPVFDAEHMGFIGSSWDLFPVVTAMGIGFLLFGIEKEVSASLTLPAAIVLIALLPASLGVLSITHSPLQSINPLALIQFVGKTGYDYLQLVLLQSAVLVLLHWLFESGMSVFLLQFGEIYLIFLIYSITGAIINRHQLARNVHIPLPETLSPGERSEQLAAQRQAVANHAYGFISRGNRKGGLQHIQSFIDEEDDADTAYAWFFNEMLSWDNKDDALFFAQTYLHYLLDTQQDGRALKLLLQCLHVNPRFRPAPADRAAVQDLAQRHGRDDLLKSM